MSKISSAQASLFKTDTSTALPGAETSLLCEAVQGPWQSTLAHLPSLFKKGRKLLSPGQSQKEATLLLYTHYQKGHDYSER